MIRLRKVLDSLRSTYWFVPSLMMVLAGVLWLVTDQLDERLSAPGNKPLGWLYFDDVASTRKLLLTIAGTVIGIVGVVFSILMVPLTIAATQFGPRLLRTFLRDTGTHITLGTFTATFVFCILVLLQLHEDEKWPLPQLSVTTGLALGLVSFGMLIFFINHIATSIQATVVVAGVSKELLLAIDKVLPDALNASPADKASSPPFRPPHSTYPVVIKAHKNGYVQTIDQDALIALAQEQDLVLELFYKPGDFVVQGTSLVNIFPKNETGMADLEKRVNKAFILGKQRTLVQDVAFGVHELVEVALRALSPGINDPFTAMNCLDWLGTALCRMCSRSFPSAEHVDPNGHLRLITKPVTFSSISDSAFNQIRDYGRTSTAVTIRLLETIGVIATCVRTEEQRKSLLKHARLVEESCKIGLPETADREAVTWRLQRVLHLLESPKEGEPGEESSPSTVL